MQINKIKFSPWFIHSILRKTKIREHHSIARFILQTSLTNFFSFLMMYNLNPVHSICGWHNIIWWKGWPRKTLMSAYHSILKTSHPHNISGKTLECFVWHSGIKERRIEYQFSVLGNFGWAKIIMWASYICSFYR